jgi:hypothetical protein
MPLRSLKPLEEDYDQVLVCTGLVPVELFWNQENFREK